MKKEEKNVSKYIICVFELEIYNMILNLPRSQLLQKWRAREKEIVRYQYNVRLDTHTFCWIQVLYIRAGFSYKNPATCIFIYNFKFIILTNLIKEFFPFVREAWFSWVISAAPEALAVPTTRNAANTYSINPLFDAMLLSLLYLIIYVNYDVFYMSFLLFWHLGLIRDCVFAFSLPSWILQQNETSR